jgi:hypothetical protein
MCLSGYALSHPAAPLLQKYASFGCTAVTGQEWIKAEIWVAVVRGPHIFALSVESVEHFHQKCISKVSAGQAKVVLWNDIKDNPPPEMKVVSQL